MKQNLTARLIFILFTYLVGSMGVAQDSPKREMRGVWVATVLNIDWPSRAGLNARQQQKEIDQLLDDFKSLNLNAVFLQIRPVSDAIYRSNYEPWSQYLSGVQGEAPNPLYDPLDYFIEGCHNRGMELHAWMNPFRVKQKPEDKLVEGHIFEQHPDWGWQYGTKTYLDPGIPEVRDFLAEIVKDVVTRYDVDGIHFDDYFYPYPIPGEEIPDSVSFEKYNNGYSIDRIADWRRNNVDEFIFKINRDIKDIKPWVQFGVSPFGVWRNKQDDPDGSDTNAGTTAYDGLYSDVIKWIRLGWVDYLVPQIYWQFDHPKADFKTLADWWGEHAFNRNMFVGHGLYRLTQEGADEAWKNPVEFPRQIRYVRKNPDLKGSIWFSSSRFFNETIGFTQFLKNAYYRNKALMPEIKWIKGDEPFTPVNIKARKVKDNNVLLEWDKPFVKEGFSEPKFYVIYRCKNGEKIDINDPKYIFDVVKHPEYLIKIPFFKLKKEEYIYRITTIDRLNSESELSNPVVINQ
ncbi:family 10 glycosylhydrolase [Saccharicrinis sp. FJH2]|uniref:glycoside hydrolase family 10 protein n=1 Tax=Saccharicrinis sp. FJH65 TaxID=3344659 RepID=UPI0035F2A0AD